jgi:hypothetical protein
VTPSPRSRPSEPPAPSPSPLPTRAGFGRFELVARFGAFAAAVAFATVLFGDVSGPTPTNSSFDYSSDGAIAERSSALTVAASSDESTSLNESASAAAPMGASTDGSAGGAAQTEAAAITPTPAATNSALVSSATATPPPTEGTASLQTTTGAIPQTAPSTGGDGGAATTGSNDAQPVPADASPHPANDTAREEPGNGSAFPDSTVESLVDRAVDSEATAATGVPAGTESATGTLATQVQESSLQAPTLQPMPGDEALSPFEADEQGISALAIALAAVTAVLASASALLWWQRPEADRRSR